MNFNSEFNRYKGFTFSIMIGIFLSVAMFISTLSFEISKEQNVSEVKPATENSEKGDDNEQNNKSNPASVSEENKPNNSIAQNEEPVDEIKNQEITDTGEKLASSNSETQSKEPIIEKKDPEK